MLLGENKKVELRFCDERRKINEIETTTAQQYESWILGCAICERVTNQIINITYANLKHWCDWAMPKARVRGSFARASHSLAFNAHSCPDNFQMFFSLFHCKCIKFACKCLPAKWSKNLKKARRKNFVRTTGTDFNTFIIFYLFYSLISNFQ